MFRVFFRQIVHLKPSDSANHVFLIQNSFLQSLAPAPKTTGHQSLTISYLINMCGLSSELALSAAQKFQLKNTEKPDSVLKLLESSGFTKEHITRLISKRPQLLLSNPDKTLKPKIQFFHGLGVPSPIFADLVSSDVNLLTMSLRKGIIPSFQFLKSLVGTDGNLILALRRSTRILQTSRQKVLRQNISVLQNNGVPLSGIAKLIIHHPRVMLTNPDWFSKNIEVTKEMGFNPLSWTFCLAARVLSGISNSNWEAKRELYKSYGWSEDEILSAFKVQPMCMITSENKIRRVMDFLVNEVKWEPSFISRCPNLFLLSFEKRIVPRCLILQILSLKGLIKKETKWTSFLKLNDKDFLEKFVIKNQDVAPEILKIYQEKVGIVGLDIPLEESEEAQAL